MPVHRMVKGKLSLLLLLTIIRANPCPISFEEPAPVIESSSVTLRCSTPSSCPSPPQIQPLDRQGISTRPQDDVRSRTATITFTASRQDNGRQFSCQTQGNTDPHLIRSITLTVEYGPRDVQVQLANANRRDGVAVKDTVTLTCSASGNPAPTYSWFRPDRAPSQGQDLIIPSITASQSGRYRCDATNKHGQGSSSLDLEVQYPPRNTTVQVPSGLNGSVSAGKELRLTCVTDAYPAADPFSWLHGSSRQTPLSHYRHIGRGSTLTIEKVQRADEGCYVCIANNSIGMNYSGPQCFQVQYAPTNIQLSMVDKVREGRTFTIRCNVSSFPPSSLTLFRETGSSSEHEVSNSNKNGVHNNDLVYSATAAVHHAGRYKCVASNSEGSATSEQRELEVQYPPRNTRVQVPSGLNGRVSAGKELRLTCDTDAYPAADSFSWFHGSSRQTPLSHYRHIHWGSTMTIEKVQRADDGCYECSATNSIGTDYSAPQCFKVQYAPTNIQLSMVQKVREGQTFTIRCDVSSFPPSSLTLFKETGSSSVNVLSNSNKNGVRNNVLAYSAKAAVHHAGRYKCVASNSEGSMTSEQRELEVQYPPRNTTVQVPSGLNGRVSAGKKLRLTCVTDAYPAADSFSWLHGSSRQTPLSYYRHIDGGSTLTIEKVQRADEGCYVCSTSNSIGTDYSAPQCFKVQYPPRNTTVQVPSGLNGRVSAGKKLRLTCVTDAYPAADSFSWLHGSSRQTPLSYYRHIDGGSTLTIEKVQRADEGCYVCSTSNRIGTGQSAPQCFKVQYAPTDIQLFTVPEVTEGQTFTISCTVSSFPPSSLTLIRETGSSSVNALSNSNKNGVHNNVLVYSAKAAVHHAGRYKCVASNSEGSVTSEQRELEVRYSPKNVAVIIDPHWTVKENTSVTFRCGAQSHPPVTSVTWTKMADGQEEVLRQDQSLTLQSVTPSDSGRYRCKASNEVGSGESPPRDVWIQYAPKETKILKAEEHLLPDKRRSVMLTCSSSSHPPIHRYAWYMKSTDDKGDVNVSSQQNHTVTSDKPGIYCCSAQNQLGVKTSDPVEMFPEGTSVTVLQYVWICASLLLIPLAACLILKCKRRLKHRATSQKQSADRAQEMQSVPLEDASAKYATVHCTKRQPEQDVVYAVVSKPRRPNKPNHDREEEEEEVNYAQVEFTRNRLNCKIGKSSRHEDENTEYSTIQF